MRNFFLYIAVCSLLTSCIDELDLTLGDTVEQQDILVVEAKLTDELKRHQVVLSRLDTILDLELDAAFRPFVPNQDRNLDLVDYEENASVSVVDAAGNTTQFSEIAPGIYESDIAFAATMDNEYRLEIIRTNGQQVTSDFTGIVGTASLDAVYAERMTNDRGSEGIGIFIDGSPSQGAAQNYRYTYDETYKVIAPDWSPIEYKLTDYDPCALPEPTYTLERIETEVERRVCFKTDVSNTIVQAEATSVENGLERLLVRFINKENFIISHRYSILVHQNVASPESFGFYQQLDNFSRSDNLFSQVQPGFLEGNLFDESGDQGKVLGFFDVVSVSSRRLFFNYEDFFPDEELPEFPFNCRPNSTPESHISCRAIGLFPGGCPPSIIERVDQDVITYLRRNNEELGLCPGPDIYVPKICGDCRELGSNVVPEFWIE